MYIQRIYSKNIESKFGVNVRRVGKWALPRSGPSTYLSYGRWLSAKVGFTVSQTTLTNFRWMMSRKTGLRTKLVCLTLLFPGILFMPFCLALRSLPLHCCPGILVSLRCCHHFHVSHCQCYLDAFSASFVVIHAWPKFVPILYSRAYFH